MPLGFETEHVVVMGINLPATRYADAAARFSFFDRLSNQVRGIPGVVNTAFADEFPLHGMWGSDFQFRGPAGQVKGTADFQVVDAAYFATLAIPVVRGRSFQNTDRAGSLPVAVVNEIFVKKYLSAIEPMGLRLDWNLGSSAPPLTIVGIVGEIRRAGKAAAPSPELYLAAAQTDLPMPPPAKPKTFAVRAAGDPKLLTAAVQKSVWSIDPEQPISGVQTLDETLSASLAERRFNMAMLLSFAALALGLALIGCYGVVAYAAAQRTREIGIRIAFGAARSDVIALIVRSGMRWAGIGLAAGIVAALGLTRIMRGLLFEITPADPSTFAIVIAAVAAVALLASYLPARRAASISPMEALRAE
jgi:putative ABC transport system permease protein